VVSIIFVIVLNTLLPVILFQKWVLDFFFFFKFIKGLHMQKILI